MRGFRGSGALEGQRLNSSTGGPRKGDLLVLRRTLLGDLTVVAHVGPP